MAFKKTQRIIWVHTALVQLFLVVYFLLLFTFSNLTSKGLLVSYLPWNYNFSDLKAIYFGLGSILLINSVFLVNYLISSFLLRRSDQMTIFLLSKTIFSVIFLIITYFVMSSGIMDSNTDLRHPTYIGAISIQKSFFFVTYFTSIVFITTNFFLLIIFYFWQGTSSVWFKYYCFYSWCF